LRQRRDNARISPFPPLPSPSLPVDPANHRDSCVFRPRWASSSVRRRHRCRGATSSSTRRPNRRGDALHPQFAGHVEGQWVFFLRLSCTLTHGGLHPQLAGLIDFTAGYIFAWFCSGGLLPRLGQRRTTSSGPRATSGLPCLIVWRKFYYIDLRR
jgi:hypothetical protein